VLERSFGTPKIDGTFPGRQRKRLSMSRARRLSKQRNLPPLQAQTLRGPAAQPYLNQATKQAIDRMSRQGVTLTPIINEPCGAICLIGRDQAKEPVGVIQLFAFPDGKMHIKAERLPLGEEYEYSTAIVQAACIELHKKRTSGELIADMGIAEVACPFGVVKFKAAVLPQGQELSYAIYMLEAALEKLNQSESVERIKNFDQFLKIKSAVPTISAVG
jgi:hypothetical protein